MQTRSEAIREFVKTWVAQRANAEMAGAFFVSSLDAPGGETILAAGVRLDIAKRVAAGARAQAAAKGQTRRYRIGYLH